MSTDIKPVFPRSQRKLRRYRRATAITPPSSPLRQPVEYYPGITPDPATRAGDVEAGPPESVPTANNAIAYHGIIPGADTDARESTDGESNDRACQPGGYDELAAGYEHCSVGYGLLKSMGWDTRTGLGRHQGGRLEPVTVVKKIDNAGIGYRAPTEPALTAAPGADAMTGEDGAADASEGGRGEAEGLITSTGVAARAAAVVPSAVVGDSLGSRAAVVVKESPEAAAIRALQERMRARHEAKRAREKEKELRRAERQQQERDARLGIPPVLPPVTTLRLEDISYERLLATGAIVASTRHADGDEDVSAKAYAFDACPVMSDAPGEGAKKKKKARKRPKWHDAGGIASELSTGGAAAGDSPPLHSGTRNRDNATPHYPAAATDDQLRCPHCSSRLGTKKGLKAHVLAKHAGARAALRAAVVRKHGQAGKWQNHGHRGGPGPGSARGRKRGRASGMKGSVLSQDMGVYDF
eukprot:jgi/Mesvir1/10604/Mv08933-RA.1